MSESMSEGDTAESPIDAIPICAECGAERDLSQPHCWLCASDGNPYSAPLGNGNSSAHPLRASSSMLDNVVVTIVVVLLILIGIGIALDEPSGLIGYLILLTPGVIATVLVRSRQRSRRKTGFAATKTAAVLIGGVAILGTVVTLVTAVVAFLLAVCAGGIGV